jgi:HPt (histidine-containing phosphotransfer) domain-containing protein
MSHPPIVDPGALARLDQLGGPGFALRIIGIFLTEGPRRIADARAALARRDGPELAHAVHALISSAGNVGATNLAELVREMEHDAEHARWEVLAGQMTDLEAAFASVVARLAEVRGTDAGT